MLPESRLASAARRLAEDLCRFKHSTTGLLGTPVICHVLSDYGPVESHWSVPGEQLKVTITIPANTQAAVRLPQARMSRVKLDGGGLAEFSAVSNVRQESDALSFSIGSGRYVLEYDR